MPAYYVGQILFDPKKDDPDFYLCDKANILEHYQTGTKYKEGTKSVRAYFAPLLKGLPERKGENGTLTVRFIVNCKGGTGRFRLLGINRRYGLKTFSDELSETILHAVKNMGCWTPGKYRGKIFDSYCTLNFKIKDGQVKDIFL